MFKKTIGLGLVATFAAGCGASVQSVGCPVQRISWAVTYKPVNAAADTGKLCANLQPESIGFQRYNDPRNPDAEQLVALRPYSMRNENGVTGSSVGTLANEPDANGVCAATDFTAASTADSVVSDQTISYAFSNVRIIATPKVPGSWMNADVVYTVGTDSCAYTAVAIWPIHGCGVVDVKDGPPDPDAKDPTAPTTLLIETGPDAASCEPAASGINADFPVTCERTNRESAWWTQEIPTGSPGDGGSLAAESDHWLCVAAAEEPAAR